MKDVSLLPVLWKEQDSPTKKNIKLPNQLAGTQFSFIQ